MSSPFPGMDPYLEDSEIWHSFHFRLANEIADRLTPLIGPKYYADVEVRSVTDEVAIVVPPVRPDVGIFEPLAAEREAQPGPALATMAPPTAPVRRVVFVPDAVRLRSVFIYTTETRQLVTAVEILSPYNKRPNEGLEEYRKKRAQFFRSTVNLVEIDLLRGGERPGREVADPPLDTDYVLLVNRSLEGDRRVSDIWPVALNEPLPSIPVPLLPPDPEVLLDLGAALRAVYDRARYDWRITYRRPVPPPDLRPAMAEWVKQLLQPDG